MKRDYTVEDQFHDEDVERESAMSAAEKRQVRIDDAEDDLRANFSTDLLVECIREADEADLQELNDALKNKENLPQPIPAMEVWALLVDIRDKWIAEYARFQVEDR